MAFKLKGHSLPGIKQFNSTTKKDGRAASAAFQQKDVGFTPPGADSSHEFLHDKLKNKEEDFNMSKNDSTKVAMYREISNKLNNDLVNKLQEDINKMRDDDPKLPNMLRKLEEEIKIKNLSESIGGTVGGYEHYKGE